MSVLDRLGLTPREAAGFLVGMGACSMALSSGFIWAYQGRTRLVFVAAFVAWTGYLCAHYAATGRFIDAGPAGDGTAAGDDAPEATADGGSAATDGVVPESDWRKAGVGVGAAVLVTGMLVGVVTIRAENHLLTNVGGALFLGGYVIAHYAETDLLL